MITTTKLSPGARAVMRRAPEIPPYVAEHLAALAGFPPIEPWVPIGLAAIPAVARMTPKHLRHREVRS